MRTRYFEPPDAFDAAADAEDATFRRDLILVPSSVRLSSSWIDSVLNSEVSPAAQQLLAIVDHGAAGPRRELVEDEPDTAGILVAQSSMRTLELLYPRCAIHRTARAEKGWPARHNS